MRRNQSGFTLVELAVVLVIVSLLLGGVFQVRSMIDSGRIKADIKALKEFWVMSMLYRDRYHRLPGEDLNHPGRFKTVLSTDSAASEGLFYDLHHAGFAKMLSPKPAIGSAFKATWGGSSGANYGLIAGQNQVCITQIEVDLAESIERQLDEGDRSQGNVEYTLNGSQLCMAMN